MRYYPTHENEIIAIIVHRGPCYFIPERLYSFDSVPINGAAKRSRSIRYDESDGRRAISSIK